ncbi:MAG: AHH domain-containing protein [Saprospiraceae bacterium]|nr:AHH domain-containing protein [Saprospiraceae bacterium]
MKKLKWIFPLFFALIWVSSCKKDAGYPENTPEISVAEEAKNLLAGPEKDFFDIGFAESKHPYLLDGFSFRTYTDSLVNIVIDRILLLNKEMHFVPAMIDQLGYPFWSRAEVYLSVEGDKHLVITPFARLDEKAVSALLLTWVSPDDPPYFALFDRNNLKSVFPNLDPTLISNIKFLSAFFNYYDATLFGTGDPDINNWLELHKDELLASEELLGFRCGNSDQVEVDICVMPLTNAIKSDPGNEELSFRECPAGWNEFNVVITVVYPCDGTNPAIGLPSIFPQGAAGWWPDPNTIITPDPQDPNAGNPALANPGLNNLGIPNLQAFFEACATQGEPGSAGNNAEVASLCDQISAVTGDIPLGSAELAWLLGEGHSDVLNFFAMWAPNQTSPASLEMAAEVIQMYAAGVLDISKGFNSFSFVKARNLMLELGLNGEQGAYLFAHPELMAEVDTFYQEILQSNPTTEEIFQTGVATQIVLNTQMQNLFDKELNDNFYNILSQYIQYFPDEYSNQDGDNSGPIIQIIIPPNVMHAREIYEESYFLQLEHTTWSSIRIYLTASYRAIKGSLHTALDIIGLIPALGEPADLVNGILYTISGDWKNATLSFGSTIPIAGWASTGAKWATTLVLVGQKSYKLRHRIVNGVIKFSHMGRLREILGMKGVSAFDNFQAHHVIPEALWDHPIVQRAAGAKSKPFHMNSPENGIPVINTRHNGSHSHYSDQILAKLNDLDPNISAQDAADFLNQYQIDLKNIISANPNLHINELILP